MPLSNIRTLNPYYAPCISAFVVSPSAVKCNQPELVTFSYAGTIINLRFFVRGEKYQAQSVVLIFSYKYLTLTLAILLINHFL